MQSKYLAAMRKAARVGGSKSLADATRVIQNALLGGLPGGAMDVATALKPAASKRTRPAAPLGDVIEALVKAKAKPARPPRPATPPPHPAGAQFLARSFTAAAGTRGYKLCIPDGAAPRPRGLVVMLHGCTQDPDDFAAGTRMNAVADEHGLLVLYPAQPRSANANGCWNWFEPRDQQRGAGEPSLIAGMATAVAAEFSVPSGKVWVAGLSAGGAMALVAAATYPDVFSAAGVHSGLAYASAGDVASAFMVMRGEPGRGPARAGTRPAVRTIIFQGDRDSTVHPANGERILAEARPVAGEAASRTVEGQAAGRGYLRTVVRDAAGQDAAEYWLIRGAGHAWSGGSAAGSYADPQGPDASREMVRFFLAGSPA